MGRKTSFGVLLLILILILLVVFVTGGKSKLFPQEISFSLGTSPQELMETAKTTTNPEVLKTLSTNKNEGVRSDVAKNAALPTDIQKRLAKDTHWMVRNYLGANPSIVAEVAEILAFDPDPRVRWTVARNPKTPENILIHLASDSSVQVLTKLVSNPNIPQAAMIEIAQNAAPTVVVEMIRVHKQAFPDNVQEILNSRGEDAIVRALTGDFEKKLDITPVMQAIREKSESSSGAEEKAEKKE